MDYEAEHGGSRGPHSSADRREMAVRLMMGSLSPDSLPDGDQFTAAVWQALATMLGPDFQSGKSGEGMPQRFIDALDRVPNARLKGQDCPICAISYLDDKYPLVVTLPCPGRHKFDLECITPWLQRNSTCPMCRHDFQKRPSQPAGDADYSDDDVDDMFG